MGKLLKNLATSIKPTSFWFAKTILFFLSVLMLMLLSACRQQLEPAPVVDGWKQSAVYGSSYHVNAGESLYAIAHKFGIDYRRLAQANHIPPPYTIKPGQKIVLTTVEQAKPTTTANKTRRRLVTKPAKTMNKPQQTVRKPITTEASAQAARHTKGKISWQWPAQGVVIKNYSPLPLNTNKGLNIAGRAGEPIVAAASGQVAYVGSGLRGYGKMIIIRHAQQFLSAYAHNKKIVVKEGQWVKAGQEIAEMGNTGANRVMLHFEIRRNGKPVNPTQYLPKKIA